jgi:glutathione S-transferase
MSDLLGELRVKRVLGEQAETHPAWRGINTRNLAMLQYADDELGKHPYIAGAEFTAADIMLEFNFSFMVRMPTVDFSGYKNIQAWLQRVRARPAYQRMTAVAAPQVPL